MKAKTSHGICPRVCNFAIHERLQTPNIEYPRHPEYVGLFDLAADPDEKMDLAEDPGHARVLAKLREHCSRTIKELLDDQTRIKDFETRESVPAKAA